MNIEYFGTMYADARLINGIWHFEDSHGALLPFVFQHRVNMVPKCDATQKKINEKAKFYDF
jgi:hypothetical protein